MPLHTKQLIQGAKRPYELPHVLKPPNVYKAKVLSGPYVQHTKHDRSRVLRTGGKANSKGCIAT